MSALRRIGAVARVELLRLLRARMTLTLLLLVPAMQVMLFGYAIRPADGVVTVAIAAADPVSAARVAAIVARAPGVRIVAQKLPRGGAERSVRDGSALIGIEVPPFAGFAQLLAPPPPVRVIVDASDPALTRTAVATIEAAYWRARAERGGGNTDGPTLAVEQLYNPQGRADWAFLPALAGVTVMIAMIMLGALGLARERETGTWESGLTLPISAAEAILGQIMPYAIIGTIEGGLVLAAGVLLFDLPMPPGAIAVVALLPLFAAAHVALGQAIAARAANQLAALQGAVAFYLPAMLLSGFLYPFATLPGWAQALGSVFPLTHFIRAARGAILRGDPASQVLTHGLPILAFLAVAGAIAVAARARRLD